MKSTDFITAAVVTYNNMEQAKVTCRSLKEHTEKYPLKLTVIDNASSDGTAEYFSADSEISFTENGKNIGFGAAHNKALSKGIGRYHFVINPDIEINSDVLSALADFMENNPDIVMAMPKILNSDGSEQFTPKETPTFKRLYLGRLSCLGGSFKKIRDSYTWADREIKTVTDIDFCSGCFFCIRGEVFEKLGGFDERFFMYLEDADLTLRAKKFGRVVMNPDICVTHMWRRESADSLKYLLIHICSSFKFLHKWRKR